MFRAPETKKRRNIWYGNSPGMGATLVHSHTDVWI